MIQQLFNMEVFRRFKNVNGIYQGVVLDNSGERGRCKIFIPQIYADEFQTRPMDLPWATPAEPLGGGPGLLETPPSQSSGDSSVSLNKTTGSCIVPRIGAHLWVFFADNDHTRPVYFAAIQSSGGWVSENRYQSTYQTENVRVRIDESPAVASGTLTVPDPIVYKGEPLAQGGPATMGTNEMSSMFGRTFNTCSVLHTDRINPELSGRILEAVPLKIEIAVRGTVQIVVTEGHANIQVNGNTYLETRGDFYNTVHGNRYERVKGNSLEVIDGFRRTHVLGDSVDIVDGASLRNILGAGGESIVVSGSRKESIGKDLVTSVVGNMSASADGNFVSFVGGLTTEFREGPVSSNYAGGFSIAANKDIGIQTTDSINIVAGGVSTIAGTSGVLVRMFNGESFVSVGPAAVNIQPKTISSDFILGS